MNVLETERLVLRQLTADDAEFMFELLNDPSFIKNIGDRQIRTLDDARIYIERGPVASYAANGFGLNLMVLKETHEPIGICGLIRREGLEDVDMGYALLPRYWSRGYAAEAARAIHDQARDTYGLNRIVAIVDPANRGSIRVLEKIGLHYERMIRLPGAGIELMLFAKELEPGVGNGSYTE